MKSSKPRITLKSFADLKGLRAPDAPETPPPAPPPPAARTEEKKAAEDEETIFQEAMADVAPLERDNLLEKPVEHIVPAGAKSSEDLEVLTKLSMLVYRGEGFVVADTPEYIEGTGYQVPSTVAKRLHEGYFAIEAHIDLHGLNAHEAEEAFDAFLQESIRNGIRAVLIIHGRGLCSPQEPVLKTKVTEWLTRGSWRKQVIAFASARSCDGGTGATYVLLRARPVTRRFKKGPGSPGKRGL
jgi:DNA-nicking Smr family endonuclease